MLKFPLYKVFDDKYAAIYLVIHLKLGHLKYLLIKIKQNL